MDNSAKRRCYTHPYNPMVETRGQWLCKHLPTPVHNWLYWHIRPYRRLFGIGIRLNLPSNW